jgi:hypothetical protein
MKNLSKGWLRLSEGLAATVVALFLVACIEEVDPDHEWTGPFHDCANGVEYSDTWDEHATLLHILHFEPRTCPVWVDYAGYPLNTGGLFQDAGGQDFGDATLRVWDSTYSTVETSFTSSFYLYSGFEYRASFSVAYDAAQDSHAWNFVTLTGYPIPSGFQSDSVWARIRVYYYSPNCSSPFCNSI